MLTTPEKLINYRVYDAIGRELIGCADIELPALESMTEEISGAGIAGTIDSPTIGHFASMTLTLNWRTTEARALALLTPIEQSLDIRAAVQKRNPIAGQIVAESFRVAVRGQTRSFGLGTLAPGSPTEATTEMEVHAITVFVNGLPVVEIDKYNMIYRINGIDYLQPARIAMGGV